MESSTRDVSLWFSKPTVKKTLQREQPQAMWTHCAPRQVLSDISTRVREDAITSTGDLYPKTKFQIGKDFGARSSL